MSILHIAFYPSDWLAGTRGLSDAETGVYITLIAKMYEMAGPIERDDERLARLCGSKTKSGFVKSLNYLIFEGKIVDGPNGLINERVEKEIIITTEKSSKARQAAQSRWDKKPNKNNGSDDANASPKHMPQPCQLEPEPDKKESTNVLLSDQPPAIDEIAICIQHFNATAERIGWPKVQMVGKPRRSALVARLKDVGGLDGWKAAIDRAALSPHLTGQNNRGWTADFDWLSKPANFTKLMEGNYDPRTGNTLTGNGTSGSGSGMVDAFAALAAKRSASAAGC